MLLMAPFLATLQPGFAEHGFVWIFALILIAAGMYLLSGRRSNAALTTPPVKSRRLLLVNRPRLMQWLRSGTQLALLRLTARSAATEQAPERISSRSQWHRAAAVVENALERMQIINECQRCAAQQVDAAEYAINLMKEELAAMLPHPAEPALPNIAIELATHRPAIDSEQLAA